MAESLTLMHVISGLHVGGAEQMLYRLVKHHSQLGNKCAVVSLGSRGDFGERITRSGVELHTLGMRRGQTPSLAHLRHLQKIVRTLGPSIIQGWMYHGNLAASFSIISRPRSIPVVWNIRQSLGPSSEESRRTRRVITAGKILSRLPSGIIYNSRQSLDQHTQLGYQNSNSLFIPNGFQAEELKKSQTKRSLLRAKYGIGFNTRVIVHIGRLHLKKDHKTFLKAFAKVLQCRPHVRLLMAGRGVSVETAMFREAMQSASFKKAAVLLGENNDVNGVLSASDIFVSSSSWGEGFSNVLGEAMAHGLACISTNVGEASAMLYESGEICAPSDAEALADSMVRMIDESNDQLVRRGERARATIERKYSIKSISQEYLNIYDRLRHQKVVSVGRQNK